MTTDSTGDDAHTTDSTGDDAHDSDALQAAFAKAVAASHALPERPDNAQLLALYALFKQASEGDVAQERPAALDFVALAKWNARAALRGTPAHEAMRRYVALIEQLGG
jgi:acyl-CoA-binding protein